MKAKKAKPNAPSKRAPSAPKAAKPHGGDKRRREVKATAYSLYSAQIDWVDQVAVNLRKAGSVMANRSLVVREAILRLQEELHNKSPQEILRDFNARQEKRALNGGV